MDEQNLISFVSFLSIVFTVAMFSSGIYTCYKIHLSKSTGVIPHLPFVSGILNCALWLTYGCFKEDNTVIIVNLTGFLLFISYTFIYFVYTTDKVSLSILPSVDTMTQLNLFKYFKTQQNLFKYFKTSLLSSQTALPSPDGPMSHELPSTMSQVKMHTGAAALFICAVIVYSYYFVSNHDTALFHLGLLSNFFTVMFFASPLSTMAEVFRTKTTESMSFPLSLLSLIVTALWVFYSYLVQDIFIKIPNLLGFVLASLQLILFALYWNNKSRKVISLELPVV